MSSEDFKYRKELALAAMAAILSNPNETVVKRYMKSYGEVSDFNLNIIAQDAFALADEMLEYEKKEKP